jgi:D-arabinose 1-dehydrogenase-like Zn-dependent alcohol dehydrogenase
MNSVQGGLAVNGTLLVIGAVKALAVDALQLLRGRRSIKGWYSGTSIDSQQTLAFSALNGVRSMNEILPLERAAEGYQRMITGQARFRVVLDRKLTAQESGATAASHPPFQRFKGRLG